jgi:PQQ-dependent catabolism-associated CXXCW motif protein
VEFLGRKYLPTSASFIIRSTAASGLVALGLFAASLETALLGLTTHKVIASTIAPDHDAVVEPESYRTDDYRKPVPLTLKGATVLSSSEAMKVWSAKTAVFIDVYPHPPKPNLPAGTIWRDTPHQTIEDAVWLPNVGYGVLSPANDRYFRRSLDVLTKADKAKPLVFFCLRNCWMSWNAAKRALSYGYTHVLWYPDGTDGWQENAGFVVDVHPLP